MSDKRTPLLEAISNYETSYEAEKKFIPEIMEFIKSSENCFERTHLAGHITGSAWVINPKGDKTLLTHHKKLNKWLQLGGHSDGDPDTWGVAMREANEESGIDDIKFFNRDIFDIDIHPIPDSPKKGEPEHFHYDVRFILQAQNEDFVVSDESNSLKWVSYDELMSMDNISESIRRMAEKWLKIIE